MPRRPAPLPDALLGRPFTRREALDLGATDHRIRRSDLQSPFHGVRDAVAVPDLQRRCLAALAVLPGGSVLSHTTALRLYGVTLPTSLEQSVDIHVHLPPGASQVRRTAITAHRTTSSPAQHSIQGLPVVTPSRAWCDVATLVEGDDLVVVGDGLLRRTNPPATLAELSDQVTRLPVRARGRQRLSDALPLLRPRTDSPMETRTRLLLVRAGLPCPSVNHLVRDGRGDVVAMPDLAFTEARIAIEYDGDVHRTNRAVWRRDVERREMLQDLGWVVLVVTADTLRHHPEQLITRVRSALRARS